MTTLAKKLLFRVPRLGIGPQIVVGVLVVGLLAAMAIEPTRKLFEQRERISQMAGDLREISRSNDRLNARIERLRNPDFLEQRAREQIGLIRPGEIAIVVMPPSKDPRPKTSRSEKAPPTPPPPRGFIEGLLNFVGLL